MFNFFDDFDGMFDKLMNNFNRPVKDQNPFSVYTSDKGYIIVCNTLGINKNDIRVNVTKEKGNPYPVLAITGESRIEKINFSNSINLRIRLKFNEEINAVSYESKDGLTLIYLKIEVEKPETLEGKLIDDSSSLDW